MLKQEDSQQQRLYNELADIANINWVFQQPSDPFTYVSALSYSMQVSTIFILKILINCRNTDYKIHWKDLTCLRRTTQRTSRRFLLSLFHKTWSIIVSLSVSNFVFRIMQVSNRFTSLYANNFTTEPWYGTKYFEHDISSTRLSSWNTTETYDIYLPPPNMYPFYKYHMAIKSYSIAIESPIESSMWSPM
jgi:secreted Zn-dependent insulinase-like peptidase